MKTLYRLCFFLLVFASHAIGGVDGGNPRRQPLYNMKLQYGVKVPGLVAGPVGNNGAVRLEGPIIYRKLGHFMIASDPPQLASGEQICASRAVNSTSVTVFWIGVDCAHFYFIQKFENLVAGVREIDFGN